MDQVDIWNKRFHSDYSHYGTQLEWLVKYENLFIEKRNKKIIDLGCGDGLNSSFLHNKGYEIIACDFSSRALDCVKNQNSNIETRCFDMTREMPFADDSIGIVLASLSTHYFTLATTQTLYSNVFRILENSGYFIFRVNSFREFERTKSNIIQTIEDDYYLTSDMKKKKIFLC